MYCFSSCPSYLYNYELNNKLECVRLCYPNSYISGKYCLACAPQCIYCYDSNANSCLQCQTGYYLSVTTCQSTCPNYYDEVNKTCVVYYFYIISQIVIHPNIFLIISA